MWATYFSNLPAVSLLEMKFGIYMMDLKGGGPHVLLL